MSAVKKWYVIYCAEDDSFSYENADKVFCNHESVKVEDEVRFKATGSKTIYEGVVKGFGDDEDEMIALRDKLNRTRQHSKDPSFHEGQRRKASVAANKNIKSAVASITNRKGSVPNASTVSAVKKSLKPKKKLSRHVVIEDDQTEEETDIEENDDIVDHNYESLVEDDAEKKEDEGENAAAREKGLNDGKLETDSIDSSGDDMTAEERKLFKQLAEKMEKIKKRNNTSMSPKTVKRMKTNSVAIPTSASEAIRQKNRASTTADNESSGDETEHSVVLPTATDSNFSGSKNRSAKSQAKSPATPNTASSSAGSDRPLGESTPKKPKRSRKRLPFVKTTFCGKMYAYCKDDPGVEELVKGSGVYVSTAKLTAAKNSSLTTTAVARKLLHIIFTEEARLACSIGGNRASGNGRRDFPRPPLDEKGVQNIISFAVSRGRKKGYDNKSDSAIKSAMNSKLCEDRHTMRLNEAALKEEELRSEKGDNNVEADNEKQKKNDETGAGEGFIEAE